MPEMLTSPSNKRIAWLHSLQNAKGRQEAGAFLLEGPHLLEAAFDVRVYPLLIVYDPEDLGRSEEGVRLMGRIGQAAAGGVEVFTATPTAIERASETRTPQGVVAAVAQEDVAPDKVRARRRGRFRPVELVVDKLSDPGNLGTLLRAALAADADEALLSVGSADPYAPKVVRAAAGAHFLLPIRASLSWDEVNQRLRGAPPVHQIFLAEAESDMPYFAADLAQRCGIIISNEAHGASAGAKKLAAQRIAIPMYNKVESLNAAVAGSVILFEAARQRRLAEERGETHEADGEPQQATDTTSAD